MDIIGNQYSCMICLKKHAFFSELQLEVFNLWMQAELCKVGSTLNGQETQNRLHVLRHLQQFWGFYETFPELVCVFLQL